MRTFIGIGSNQGNGIFQIRRAVRALDRIPKTFVARVSSLYLTEPLRVFPQAWFTNGVVELFTELDLLRLLAELQEIEIQTGRDRTISGSPRPIDLDILLYGDLVYGDSRCVIPHPRMSERDFVLRPLLEIAPRITDPATGKLFSEMLKTISSRRMIPVAVGLLTDRERNENAMTKIKRMTIPKLQAKKAKGEKIAMLTAYDFPFAQIIAEAGIDIILVGDSLAMVGLGHNSTLPATMDIMIHHAKAVRKGAPDSFIVGDMPFLSYNIGMDRSLDNAGRFIQEAGMQAVKVEGGRRSIAVIKAFVKANIAVMGHLGLTPQSVHQIGGYRVQGMKFRQANELIEDAIRLEKAGVFTMVLESIPWKLARIITETVSVPTIGIGAGPYCDGQVLVTQDMLGLFDLFMPKFVKRYMNLRDDLVSAIREYGSEVAEGVFPTPEHSYEGNEDPDIDIEAVRRKVEDDPDRCD